MSVGYRVLWRGLGLRCSLHDGVPEQCGQLVQLQNVPAPVRLVLVIPCDSDVAGSILLIAVGNCLENVFRNTVMARVMVRSVLCHSS